MRILALPVLIVATLWAGFSTDARAQTQFNGNWSVQIITNRGNCDRAYRYGVQIYNGRIAFVGNAPVNFFGTVTRAGSVRVTVSAGEQRANGSGRLGRDSGRGVWRGRGPTGACSGTWVASRY
jgi:hypothetical protein